MNEVASRYQMYAAPINEEVRKAINGHVTRAREVAVTMLATDEV